MSGNRNKEIDYNHTPTEYVDISPATIVQHSPLLVLPTDLLKPVADTNKGISITSVGSEADGTIVMSKLSQTCKFFNQSYKQALDKRAAKKLLVALLQGPIQGNADYEAIIIKMAKTHPSLFFIKSTAQDNAMDLEGNRRTIKDWSPYQALFGTGNSGLLAQVKPHLDTYLKSLPNGDELAYQQEQEKFPNGFDFPPCTDEFNQLVNALADAITNDQQLGQDWSNPNSTTLAALERYRQASKPGIVETGHHYNMNNTIKVHEIYDRHWSPWNGDQLAFFSVNIIGFEERLMTEFYLRVACRGLKNHVEENQPLNQNFEVMHYNTVNPAQKMSAVPSLSEDPSCRLGSGFVIDSYYACWGTGPLWRVSRRSWIAWKTMSSKNIGVFKTYAHAKETSGIALHDCLR